MPQSGVAHRLMTGVSGAGMVTNKLSLRCLAKEEKLTPARRCGRRLSEEHHNSKECLPCISYPSSPVFMIFSKFLGDYFFFRCQCGRRVINEKRNFLVKEIRL